MSKKYSYLSFFLRGRGSTRRSTSAMGYIQHGNFGEFSAKKFEKTCCGFSMLGFHTSDQ